MIDRDSILELIGRRRDELRQLGVEEIALFGSFARGEGTEESDVDLLVDLRDDRFDTYMDVKFYLEELLQWEVDLVVKDALRQRIRDVILREAVRAA